MLFGGAEGDRTPDLRIANAALCQTELLPHAHENTVSSLRFQVSKSIRWIKPQSAETLKAEPQRKPEVGVIARRLIQNLLVYSFRDIRPA